MATANQTKPNAYIERANHKRLHLYIRDAGGGVDLEMNDAADDAVIGVAGSGFQYICWCMVISTENADADVDILDADNGNVIHRCHPESAGVYVFNFPDNSPLEFGENKTVWVTHTAAAGEALSVEWFGTIEKVK